MKVSRRWRTDVVNPHAPTDPANAAAGFGAMDDGCLLSPTLSTWISKAAMPLVAEEPRWDVASRVQALCRCMYVYVYIYIYMMYIYIDIVYMIYRIYAHIYRYRGEAGIFGNLPCGLIGNGSSQVQSARIGRLEGMLCRGDSILPG